VPLNVFDGLVIEAIKVSVVVRFTRFREAVISRLISRNRSG